MFKVSIKNNLKKYVKSNDKIANIVRYLIAPITIVKIIGFNLNVQLRKYNIRSGEEYKLLRQFKDIYKEKRCFIVATGPSLQINDLEMLKNEITFSMNSIYLSYKKTDWRPTYYGIQDPLVYEKIYHEIKDEDFEAGNLECLFGSINLDLRKATLSKETFIKVSNILGSTTIFVPADVTVKVKSNTILGEVGNKNNKGKTDKIIYLDAFCILGDIKIK